MESLYSEEYIVYIVYKETDNGRVYNRNVECVTLTEEDAISICISDEYFYKPFVVDKHLIYNEYIFVVMEEDYSLFSSEMNVKSIHASQAEADSAMSSDDNYLKILKWSDGIFC